MANRLNGEVVVITGASSGIGAALARACSARGARVAVAARRGDRLAEVADSCRGETMAVPCDVALPEDRQRLVDAVIEKWGRISVLVNNAGLGLYASFDQTCEADLRRLVEVNFMAVFGLTQLVLPIMRAAGRGTIVNVASTGGLVSHAPSVSAYLAVKHAVVGLSRGLRRDLEGTGVSVQVVCPHLTDTEFFETGVGAEEMRAAAEPLRQRMDRAEDVAEGMADQIGTESFIVFPTERARAAYERFRDL
jgi:short-subunit dehydrogenase